MQLDFSAWTRFASLLALAYAMLLAPAQMGAQVVYNGTRSTVVSGYMVVWGVGSEPIFPTGLVVDHKGNLWVNDLNSKQLLEFVPSGAGYTLLLNVNGIYGRGYSTEQDVSFECGDNAHEIAVDSNNNIYYPATGDSGRENNCIDGAQENGNWFSGTDPYDVLAVAVDSFGNAYLADPTGAAIWLYPPPVGQLGQVGKEFCFQSVSSKTGGPITVCENSYAVVDYQILSNVYPYTIAVDRSGNVFFTDGASLYEGVSDGNGNYNVVTVAANQFNRPNAIAVNSQGAVYLTTNAAHLVREIPTPSGWVQTIFGGFSLPTGVAVDDSDNVFVGDETANQVIKFSMSPPAFGSQNVGSTSGILSLSFTVLPGTTLGSVAIVTNGQTNGDFADGGSSTCTAKTYTTATDCTMTVTFTPSVAGPRGGAIVFNDGSGNPIGTVHLTGTGMGPVPVFEVPSAKLISPSADSYYDWGANAPDAAGNLYVTVPSANEIQVIAPGGATSTLSLSSPISDPSQTTANSTLNNPTAIAFDSLGSLYIADTGNNRVVVRQPVGVAGSYYLYNLRMGSYSLSQPQGVAIDAAGDVFIADTGNNRILEVKWNGVPAVFVKNVPSPTSLAIDSGGNVYFTDDAGRYVWKASSDGTTVTQVSSEPVGLELPVGVAVDAAGTLYVADQKLGVVEIPASGSAHAINLPWPLDWFGPEGISLDSSGNVYLSESPNGVYELLRNGVSLNFVTTKTGATSTDSPQTVLMENAGNLPLNITGIAYPADFPKASGDSNACTGSTSLNPGATCDLPVNFAPTVGTSLSEQVMLTDNAFNMAGATQAVSVTGTGVVGGQSQSITSPLPGGVFTKTPTYSYATGAPLIYISATSGLPVTLTVLSGPGNFNGSNTTTTTSAINLSSAGTIVILATQGGNATYAPAKPVTFQIGVTPDTIIYNTRYTSFTQVYGAAQPTVNFLLSGLVKQTDQVYLTITGGASPSSPVGNDPITVGLTGPMASSYQLASTSTTGTLVVTPAPLTVAATDAYMNAGSSVPTLSYTLMGLAAGDTAATALTGAPILSTTATSASAAGSYPITISLGTLTASNYTLTPANGVLNVFSPLQPSGNGTGGASLAGSNTSVAGVAVGSVGTANVSFQIGPASTFAGAQGGTNAADVNVFRASEMTCTAGTCTGTISFRPTIPGFWSGELTLFDKSMPPQPLITIPVTGTGTAPQAVFSPSWYSTIGSGLQFPTGVAVDSSENVYVADSKNSRVLEYPGGTGTPVAIGSGLLAPTGVAVDSLLNVYISDTGNGRVVMVPAGGAQVTLATGFMHPAGIAADAVGDVYLADSQAASVYKIPSGGGTPVVLGAGWIAPYGISLDGAGDLFVTDSKANDVVELPAGGGAQVNVPFSGLNAPAGVVVNSVGDLFVSDTGNNRVQELSAVTGQQITLLSGLSNPYLPAIDRFGFVYVPDSGNNRVLILNPYSPPALAFGGAGAGATSSSSPQTVTAVNTGNLPLQISAVTYPADFPEATGVATDCSSSTSLASGTSCTLSINFSPLPSSSPGALNESVSITDNTLNGTSVPQSTSLTGTVQSTQTITFAPTSPVYYGNPPLTLSATGGASGNPVVFSIVSGPGSVSGTNNSTLTITGVGTIVVAANQAGNSSYAAATQVTRSVTVVAPTPPALTTPTPGSTLSGSAVTFDWSAGVGPTEYALKLGTTSYGSYDVYNGTATTALTAPVTGIPTNGAKLYAQLVYKLSGVWKTINYSYTESGTPTPPALTTPTPGTTLGGSSVTFDWTAGAGTTEYALKLGTTGAGSSNVYNGVASTALNASVTGIPTNGVTLNAQLVYKQNGVWKTLNYTYIEPGIPTPPALTTPTPGSTLSGSSVTFDWTAGAGTTEYALKLGTTGAGSSNVYNGVASTALSASVTGIPTNGVTLNAQLVYKQNGVWKTLNYTYIEPGIPTPPALTTPTPGSTLSGSAVTFDWTAGAGTTEYALKLGTTGAGSSNVYNGATTTALSVPVTGIPTNGVTLNAQLVYKQNGVWKTLNYTYIESGIPTPPALTTPAPGTTLSGSSVTFDWTAGAGTTEYALKLGTTGAGSSNVYNGATTTALSASVTGIPTNGVTLRAQLVYKQNGVWKTINYTYTEQ